MNHRRSIHRLLCAALGALWITAAAAAPKPDLWARWEAHDPTGVAVVDHSPWDRFLNRYLVTTHPSGIHRLPYAQVSTADREALRGYVRGLEAVAVSGLSRPEQRAFWINLYNATTVLEVLDHYPVDSIRAIRSGLFSAGPWDKKLLRVEGEKVTLNDIEHRILRPIWRDNRLHYAVNCASLGCPNLPAEAFTAGNSERLLEAGARAYVNHPRGARFEDGRLHASSIYDWFQVDFGGTEAGVVEHLRRFAGATLAEQLEGYRGPIEYGYDWRLNE